MAIDNNKMIILFDGVCNLCEGFVKFVIQHDSKSYFMFAPLQSEYSQNILDSFLEVASGLHRIIGDELVFVR